MQLWMFVGILLNSFSAYWVARKWKVGFVPSLIAGIIFSSSLPMTQLSGHAQLIHRWATPLAVYYFIVFLKERKLLDPKLLIAIAFLCIQFLCSPNLGVGLFLLLCSLFLVRRNFYDHRSDNKPNPRYSVPSVVSAIVVILVTAMVVYKYNVIKADFGLTRSKDEIMFFTPSFGNLLVADHSYLWSRVSINFGNATGRGEAMMFPGVLVLITLVLTAKYRNLLSNISRGFFIAITILFLMIVQIGNTSILSIFSFMPGIDSLRAPGRVILIMLFPIAIVVAQSVERIRWIYFSRVFFLLVIFEFTQVTVGLSTEDQWMAPVHEMEQLIRADSNKPFLVLDSAKRSSYLLDIDAMLVSLRQDRATLNGYSGFIPTGWENIETCDDVLNLISEINRVTGQRLNMSDFEIVPVNCS
jgi:hypothetical protein